MSRLSLIDEHGERRVRMAALSIVASHRVNGVSALHSELMVQTIFADFARLFPGRFTNVTNGVTPRRWLAQANPGLSQLLDGHIGGAWRHDLSRLVDLGALAEGWRTQRDTAAYGVMYAADPQDWSTGARPADTRTVAAAAASSKRYRDLPDAG